MSAQRSVTPDMFLTGNLRGILLPITTPFTSTPDAAAFGSEVPSEVLDTAALKSNIVNWKRTGIVGLVVLGSTGERVHLDEREYLQVIEAARGEVPSGPDGLAFIVGA